MALSSLFGMRIDLGDPPGMRVDVAFLRRSLSRGRPAFCGSAKYAGESDWL